MRTYGRISNSDGTQTWVEVETDAAGRNDMVWLTTLCQALKLNLNESPFYANYGIPQKQAVIQQVWPDFNVALTQQLFSQYFASLIVAKQDSTTPTYRVNVTTNQGVVLDLDVPVPT